MPELELCFAENYWDHGDGRHGTRGQNADWGDQTSKGILTMYCSADAPRHLHPIRLKTATTTEFHKAERGEFKKESRPEGRLHIGKTPERNVRDLMWLPSRASGLKDNSIVSYRTRHVNTPRICA